MRAKQLQAVAAGILFLGVMAPAEAAFIENFTSGWSNGTGSNLGAEDATHNGWTPPPTSTRSQFVIQAGGLTNANSGNTVQNKTWGKVHGQDLTNVGTIDLAFTTLVRNNSSISQGWLSDGNQNGYGLSVLRTTTDNLVSIVKFHDGANPFGGARVTQEAFSSAVSYVPSASDDYHALFLRIEQLEDDVRLTVWSNAMVASSYDNPLLQVLDSDFFFTGGALDLSSLTHAGMALRRDINSGGLTRVGLVQIETTPIPEPASLALLGLGGLLAATRRRLH